MVLPVIGVVDQTPIQLVKSEQFEQLVMIKSPMPIEVPTVSMVLPVIDVVDQTPIQLVKSEQLEQLVMIRSPMPTDNNLLLEPTNQPTDPKTSKPSPNSQKTESKSAQRLIEVKKSFRDKQMALRKHLVQQKKMR